MLADLYILVADNSPRLQFVYYSENESRVTSSYPTSDSLRSLSAFFYAFNPKAVARLHKPEQVIIVFMPSSRQPTTVFGLRF